MDHVAHVSNYLAFDDWRRLALFCGELRHLILCRLGIGPASVR